MDWKTRSGDDDADERIGALLRSTGRRPDIPDDRRDRVRAAVAERWGEVTRKRARRRRLWITAAAAVVATLALALALGRWPRPTPAPAGAVAGQVEARIGAAWTRAGAAGTEAPPTLPGPGTDVRVGAELATEAGGRLAIRLTSGHSMRLDEQSRARLLAGGVIVLDRGAVYIDSGRPAGAASGAVEIRTDRGTIREFGTQFEARLLDRSLVVRVREGAVSWSAGQDAADVGAGEEWVLPDDGPPSRRALAADAGEWGWAREIAPAMDIDGRTLREFLDWIARERGVRLEFAAADLETLVGRTRLSGSITGMTLDQALASVLATSRLGSRTDAGTLVVTGLGAPERS
jgi:ferric-dicitrate binding protein FerR (iron transport regulator)